jgi:hypothetical protein
MAGGTYNRFLPIAVARSKFLPLAQGIDEEELHQLGASLRDRLAEGTALGAVTFTGAGGAAWKRLYVEFGSDHGEKGSIAQFTARAAPNCLRIAAIHAALDHASKIGPEHLAAAAALVRYSIDSARSVFTNNHVLSRHLDRRGRPRRPHPPRHHHRVLQRQTEIRRHRRDARPTHRRQLHHPHNQTPRRRQTRPRRRSLHRHPANLANFRT